MSLSYILGQLFFPPRCAVCGELLGISENKYDPRACLCKDCLSDWDAAKRESCPECLCPSHLCLCGVTHGRLKGFKLPKLLSYDAGTVNTQNKIIYATKHKNEKRLTSFLASELCVSLCRYLKDEGISPDECIFTFVPRRNRSVREYGFDQAKRLSREMSDICEGEFSELYVRKRGKEQKKLGAHERASNISSAISLCKNAEELLRGRTVVLVDDLVTSGATLGTAAYLAKRAGAQRVVVASIARTVLKENG